MAKKNFSSRKKHVTINAIFPTGDVLRIKDEAKIGEHDGVLIVGAKKGGTDSDRRQMKERQFIMRYSDFKEALISQVSLTGSYDDIAARDAAPESSKPSALSFVRHATADPIVGRDVWALYIYDSGAYVLMASKDDVIYHTDLGDAIEVSVDTGNFLAGITTVADLRDKSFSKILDQMLFVTNATSVARSGSYASVSPPTGTVEYGTTITWSTTASFNPGAITNGDGSPGPNLVGDANQYVFTNPDGTIAAAIPATGNTQAYVAPAYKIAVESISMSVNISYDAGTGVYTDSGGNPTTVLDAQRVAGSLVIGISATFTGRAYGFWDATAFPTNSAGVRAATNKMFLSSGATGTFNITIPAGQKEVWFSVPTGKSIQVLYVESSNADVSGEFAADPFLVTNGGGTGDAVAYETWKSTIPGTGYPSDATYKVTIS